MALGLVHGWLAVICLLASCVSAQLKSSVPITPLLELQAGRVIPDVANNLASPSKNVTISYAGGATVGYGNELQVSQAQTAPTVDVINGSDPTGLYTLILQDPDVPDPATATGATYVHWLVVNISGAATINITSTGVALAPYTPPDPNSGLHRYVFTLFKQNASVPIVNVNFTRVFGRPKIFAPLFSLGDPVAAKYFVAQPAGLTNLTNTTVPETVEVQQLLKGKVIPNVVPLFNPLARLNVSYTNGSLDYGQILLPEQVASQPAVYVQGLNPGTIYNSTFPYFTLAIVDPDAPDPTTPTSSLILHLLKVNIPTNTPASNILSNTTGGNVLQAYRGPSPPSGLHRYAFLLYGQGRLSNASAPASRSLFNITSFALNNTLGLPLAAFYFNSIRAANASTPAPTTANGTNGTVTPVTPSSTANATAPEPTTANGTNGTVTPVTPAPTAGSTPTPSATTGASPTPSETTGPTPVPSPKATAAPAPASA